MKNERNYGLDLARILAMCGIITLHILGQGGELISLNPNSGNYWISQWVEICAYCSVDLFALLSGWLGLYKSKQSIYRTLELLGIVLFYSIVITIIFILVAPNVFGGIKDIVKSILPMLVGRYWYITCYIPLAIFQPFINQMILSLSQKRHGILCILSVILFSVITTFIGYDFFALKEGYSFIQLVICYTIGAYLRRVVAGGLEISSYLLQRIFTIGAYQYNHQQFRKRRSIFYQLYFSVYIGYDRSIIALPSGFKNKKRKAIVYDIIICGI